MSHRKKPYKRHHFTIRLWHWVMVLSVFALLMSGLTIFNAHPRLYWGQAGHWQSDNVWLAIGSGTTASGAPIGYTKLGGAVLDTTGVLGYSQNSNGRVVRRAFPSWATVPSYYSLADGRRWHFFFAWALSFATLFYLISSIFTRHIKRDLWPERGQWSPKIWMIELFAHLRFNWRGKADSHYIAPQKLAYLFMGLLILPLLIITGLAMSPGMNAALPFLTDIFGGRQSARSVHFICAFILVVFAIGHLLLLFLNHPLQLIWGMMTGGKSDEKA